MDKTESYGTMLNPAPYVVRLQKERDDLNVKLDFAQRRIAELEARIAVLVDYGK